MREQALGTKRLSDVLSNTPVPTTTWGLLTIPEDIRQWLKTPVPDSPSTTPREHPYPLRIWPDGSGINPKDPIMRTVAWGLTWQAEGEWREAAGGVQAGQSVARAELQGMIEALKIRAPAIYIASDCSGVVKGANWLLDSQKATGHLIRGAMGDLWVEMSKVLKNWDTANVVIRWIPAHQNFGRICK